MLYFERSVEKLLNLRGYKTNAAKLPELIGFLAMQFDGMIFNGSEFLVFFRWANFVCDKFATSFALAEPVAHEVNSATPGAGFAIRAVELSGRLRTTSVMQTLSGLSGRLSQGESDLTLPPGGSSEARGG